MEDIFIKILNMSITASYFALAIIILRALFRKMPKWISCLLWGLVGIRLILPFSFESILSIIPSTQTLPSDIIISKEPQINSGIPILNSTVNPIINEAFAPEIYESVNPLQVIMFVACVLWIAGIIGMLLYALISYILLRRKTAVSIETDKGVFICDNIETPFILGVIKPKIYIPSFIGEEDKAFILSHEKAHIKRKDHFWKPLGFLILTLHWFNPIMWVVFILLCRDIEAACDEKVIKEMETDGKKSYSEALINCSAPKKYITACPLAFGETGVKQRIKNVLNYKKPAFWVVLVALILSVFLSVFFLTDPTTPGINSIEGYEDILRSVEKLQFRIPESYTYTTEDPSKELRVLKRIKIDPDAVSDDRSTERDSTYKIEVNDKNTIYIDGSFSELWLDDKQSISLNINLSGSSDMKIDEGKLPSLTYKIKNPEILKKLFDEIYNPPEPIIGTETSPIFTEFEGVYLTLKSIDTNPGGHKVFNLIWNNTTDTDITYGEFYDIEIKNGDTWESVATEDITFITIGYLLKADSTANKQYSTQRYDISKIGTYRLVSTFSSGDGNIYHTYIEFQIKNDGGDISDIGGVDGPEAVISTKSLTLADVIRLSEKGEDLSMEDFDDFTYTETNSGKTRIYNIDEKFHLTIDRVGDEDNLHILLNVPSGGAGRSVDMKTGDVESFINKIALTKQLTLDDVIRLSKKGDKLSYKDFEDFYYIKTGSGLYIQMYEIDEMFSFAMGWTANGEEPIYFYLMAKNGLHSLIDIRTNDVEAFIEEHKDDLVIEYVNYSIPAENNEEIYHKFLEIGEIPPKAALSSIRALPTVKITSTEELDIFLNKLNETIKPSDTSLSLKTIFSDYTEEYFRSSSLIIVYASSDSSNNGFDVEYIAVSSPSEAILSIGISESVAVDANKTKTGNFILISVANEAIKDVKKIDAVLSSTVYPQRQIYESEAIRTYVFEDSCQEIFKPNFTLYENGRFIFNFSPTSSYFGTGRYEKKDNTLILRTNDGRYVYTFK